MKKAPLALNKSDHIASVAKGVAGAIPLVGGLVGEIIGTIIPNQRVDRIAAYLKILSDRVDGLTEACIRDRLSSPEGISLIEDSLLIAYRARTENRRRHIASIVITSLSDETMKFMEGQRMLALLDQLNDAEVVLVQAYAVGFFKAYAIVRENQEFLFESTPVMSDPAPVREEYAIRQSYHSHLESLGLIFTPIEIERRSYAESTMVKKKPKITPLGLAFTRFIGGELPK